MSAGAERGGHVGATVMIHSSEDHFPFRCINRAEIKSQTESGYIDQTPK